MNSVMGGHLYRHLHRITSSMPPFILRVLNSIEIEKIQPRMMCTTFNGHPCIIIVSCCSPTNASYKTGIITIIIIYSELSFFARHIPKHDVHIISHEMNINIDKYENNKFRLQNSLNKNGEYIAEFLYPFKKKKKEKKREILHLPK